MEKDNKKANSKKVKRAIKIEQNNRKMRLEKANKLSPKIKSTFDFLGIEIINFTIDDKGILNLKLNTNDSKNNYFFEKIEFLFHAMNLNFKFKSEKNNTSKVYEINCSFHPYHFYLFRQLANNSTKVDNNIIKELRLITKDENNKHNGLNKIYQILKTDTNNTKNHSLIKAIVDECKYRSNLFIKSFSQSNLFGRHHASRSKEVDLLYSAIAQYQQNIKFNSNILTLEELMIAQQKRDVIKELRKEINRLHKDSMFSDFLFVESINFKIDAYLTLISLIQTSSKSENVKNILSSDNLKKKLVVSEKGEVRQWKNTLTQKIESMTIENALLFKRGYTDRPSKSEEKLKKLRTLIKPKDLLSQLQNKDSISADNKNTPSFDNKNSNP